MKDILQILLFVVLFNTPLIYAAKKFDDGQPSLGMRFLKATIFSGNIVFILLLLDSIGFINL